MSGLIGHLAFVNFAFFIRPVINLIYVWALCAFTVFLSLSFAHLLTYVRFIRVVLYARPRQVSFFAPPQTHTQHTCERMCMGNCHHAASYCNFCCCFLRISLTPWTYPGTNTNPHTLAYTYMNIPAHSHTHIVTCLPRNCCCAPADYTHRHIHVAARSTAWLLRFICLLLWALALLNCCCYCRLCCLAAAAVCKSKSFSRFCFFYSFIFVGSFTLPDCCYFFFVRARLLLFLVFFCYACCFLIILVFCLLWFCCRVVVVASRGHECEQNNNNKNYCGALVISYAQQIWCTSVCMNVCTYVYMHVHMLTVLFISLPPFHMLSNFCLNWSIPIE